MISLYIIGLIVILLIYLKLSKYYSKIGKGISDEYEKIKQEDKKEETNE